MLYLVKYCAEKSQTGREAGTESHGSEKTAGLPTIGSLLMASFHKAHKFLLGESYYCFRV